jgi:hypothetical protein
MSEKADLLETRFRLNMNRISELVRLLSSNDALKATTVFGNSSGARADILRAIVVFLHATFEDALRSHIPKPGRSLSFYSRTDLDKALKSSGIDAMPFRSLYPTLTQMAKRRKRIVHEADLLRGDAHEWSMVDDWQLIMWLLAVPAFYYQLRISVGVANPVERAMYKNLRTAMEGHVAYGKQLVTVPAVPPELTLQALQQAVATLKSIISTLHLDPRAFSTDCEGAAAEHVPLDGQL